ncbi:hypothetical protein PWG71_01330 [Nocardiopsis sp. N85]|uniref:hypothetical protein n=1 Tax=Nocardiopsis sp. N85 TaxID=3029400 RepID=UPI00237F2175|nr:hypothetical protein [Nocardiopsis sp. N85]MDE3720013.1 hypothetical protein [Nocardiopsis sp. N85]
MVITPRRTVAALAAVALTLTVASCGGGNPAEGPRPDAAAGGQGRDGDASAPSSAEEREAPPPPDADTAAERTYLSQRIQGTDITVGVDPLVRTGDLVELTLTIHIVDGYLPRDLLDVGDGDGTALEATELIDAHNLKAHRVARDENGVCVCSDVGTAPELETGDVLVLGATFAAPPEDVTEMNVRVPFAGTFTGVPVV